MLYDVKAKIEKNKKISSSVYYLELAMAKIPAKLAPGHFVHIRLMHTNDPLLRRPLSVNKIIKKKVQVRGKSKVQYNVGIVYKIVGKGTSLLKEMAIGEIIDVLGPLGNGFDLGVLKDKKTKKNKNQPILFVSGGMGVAPLIFLSQILKASKAKNKITAFVGMDTKKELICLDDLKSLGCSVKVSTDDGSQGFKGYVSELLRDYLLKTKIKDKVKGKNIKPYIFACGPKPMLRALAEVGREFDIPGQVSIDEMMGCGIGACLGCVVKTRHPKDDFESVYKRICKDGPVFDINEILWEE